jgi:hypothetical protein
VQQAVGTSPLWYRKNVPTPRQHPTVDRLLLI